MAQQTFTPTDDLGSYVYGYTLSYLIDGDFSSGTVWGDHGTPFHLTLTFASPTVLTSLKVQGGQFNGNYNKPTSIAVYRGDDLTGVLLTTITPTYSFAEYSFSNTTASTVYTLVLTPPGTTQTSLIELQAFGTTGPSFGTDFRGLGLVLNSVGGELRETERVGFDRLGGELRSEELRLNSVGGQVRGRLSVLNSFGGELRCLLRVFFSAGGEIRSLYQWFNLFGNEVRGLFGFTISVGAAIGGLHRVANDADDRYELFLGMDAIADVSGSAWATFTTLPYTTSALTPPGSGTRSYHLVLRKRNRWGLTSLNVSETIFTINPDGTLVDVLPSAPFMVTAGDVAGGIIEVTGRYLYRTDGANQADQWLVYVTDDGTDPDPASLDPVVVTMVKADGVAKLDWLSDAFADGTVVKVLVRTRRSATPADSSNTMPLSATASATADVATPEAGIYLGASEQVQ